MYDDWLWHAHDTGTGVVRLGDQGAVKHMCRLAPEVILELEPFGGLSGEEQSIWMLVDEAAAVYQPTDDLQRLQTQIIFLIQGGVGTQLQ